MGCGKRINESEVVGCWVKASRLVKGKTDDNMTFNADKTVVFDDGPLRPNNNQRHYLMWGIKGNHVVIYHSTKQWETRTFFLIENNGDLTVGRTEVEDQPVGEFGNSFRVTEATPPAITYKKIK